MNVQRLRAFARVFALAAFTLGAAPSGPMGAVQKFVDGFNAANASAMQAVCSSDTGIIDDFPPYTWMSCKTWYNDFVAFSKQDGDTVPIVTLGTPAHLDVTGSLAYVVVPTTYTYKHHGKPVT